jgi:predicted nucleic acid-binding protein
VSLQYVDASVILRIIINAAGALPEGTLLYPTSSALLQVECLRTLDRFQISGELKRDEIPRSYAALHEAMSRIQLLKIDEKIVERAGGPFGVPLKTLDAIHLVTAIAWRERLNEEVTFLTHDNQLATAAREHDFPVIGAPKETETSAQ